MWHPIDSTQGLPGAGAFQLAPDLAGGMIVIANGRLYHGSTNHFDRLPIEQVFSAVSCGKDSIIALCPNALYLLVGDKVMPFPANIDVPFDRYTRILRTSSGNIWLWCAQCFYKLDSGRWRLSFRSPRGGSELRELAENTGRDGFLSIQALPGRWEWKGDAEPRYIPDPFFYYLTAMDMSDDGDIIAVNLTGNVVRRHNDFWTVLTGIQSRFVRIIGVKFRRNGDLWIASSDGLDLYHQPFPRWTQFTHSPPDLRDWVNEIMIAHDGRLWLATAGGITILNGDSLVTFCTQIDGVSILGATAIAEDRDGNVWISSGGAFTGAYRWDGRSWKYFRVTSERLDINVHRIQKDRSGRLWFLGMRNPSTLPQPGAFVYDGTFRHVGTEDGLSSGRVYAFLESADSAYWFATKRGLDRWKPVARDLSTMEGVWKHWTSEKGLRSGNVFALALDKKNRVWFADEGTGIGYLEDDGRTQYCSTLDGLISNRVESLCFDSTGRLWSGTLDGLGLLNDGVGAGFSPADGFPGRALWPVVISHEKLYAGTIGQGLVMLDLHDADSPPPIVVIDQHFTEDDETLVRWRVLSFWGVPAAQTISSRYRIDRGAWTAWSLLREQAYAGLSAGTHTFEVEAKDGFGFIGRRSSRELTIPQLFYLRPAFFIPTALLSLAVLLMTASAIVRRRRHTAALRRSEAKFRRLTEATFEGIILHDQGIIIDINSSLARLIGYSPAQLVGRPVHELFSAESHDQLRGIIEQEFEEPSELICTRSDAMALVTEVISKHIPSDTRSIGVLTVRDITERRKVQEQLLMYQTQLRTLASDISITEERERTRFATYLHDSVGHALALCKIKLDAFQHDHSPSDIRDIVKILDDTIRSTRSLTFELSPPVIRELAFDDALEWLIDQFKERNELLILVESDHGPRPKGEDDRTFLYHAVRELFMNIIKHSHAHSVELSIRSEAGTLTIEIADDGVGFDPERIDLRDAEHRGYGLFSLRERLRHFGGKLTIHSHPERGARIEVQFPIGDRT